MESQSRLRRRDPAAGNYDLEVSFTHRLTSRASGSGCFEARGAGAPHIRAKHVALAAPPDRRKEQEPHERPLRLLSLRRALRRQPRAPRRRPLPRGDPQRAARDGDRGGRGLGGRHAARGRCTAATATTTPSSRRRSACSPTRTRCSATCARARPASRARSSRWRSILMHAEVASTDGDPGGDGDLGRQRQHRPGRCSPTGRRAGRGAGSTGRTWSSPRPAIPPSTRPATCSAIELRRVPVDPETTLVRPGRRRGG